MKDSGGRADTGPMLEYGNKALDLQEKIYKEQRADAQPWYQAGTGAVNRLSTLMGIAPGSSASSRQSLIDQYTPQFTTTSQKTTGQPNTYKNASGQIFTLDEPTLAAISRGWSGPGNIYQGIEPVSSSESVTNTDIQGLNAYVDNLLSQQNSAAQNDPGFGMLTKSFGMDDYQADPGYQFRLAEGTKALERKLNAAGKTYSPEAVKALMSYNQGLGSEEYGNAYNRYNQDQGTLFNRLATLSGFGQNASGQIANAGSNYANQGTDLLTGMGNSITAANVARAQQGSSMFNTLLGAGAQLGGSYFLSDRRLKENIIPYGEENGYKTYIARYSFDPDKTPYVMVMADEVAEKCPEAVHDVNGYLAVDYAMIGVEMRPLCH